MLFVLHKAALSGWSGYPNQVSVLTDFIDIYSDKYV